MSKQTIRVVSAAITQDDRYLITQRNETAVLPLLWEFPGGRVNDGESDQSALRRVLAFRIGAEPHVGDELSTVVREYRDYVVELKLYACELDTDSPQALGVRDLRWVASNEFDAFEFTPADQDSMDALLGEG